MMNEHSKISSDSRMAAIESAMDCPSKLRLALVPSFGLSSTGAFSLDQLGDALGRETDIAVPTRSNLSRGVIRREIELWASTQTAQTLVVQICGLVDLAMRWFPSLIIARLDAKRIVGVVDFESTQFQKPVVRWIAQKLLGKADTLVTSTEWQAGGLRRIGLTAQVIAPINESATAKVTCDVQPHVCVVVDQDQLGEWERIVQSFALVKQKYPRAEMTVSAARKLHPAIYGRMAIVNSSATQSVRIVDQPQTSSEVHGDIVISLDRDSEFPRQLLSAWSTGRPVLVPAYSLVSSVVRDGANSLVYSSSTLSGLADAVIRLVEHPELVQQLSSQGLMEARSYQWDSLRIRWRQILIAKK